MYDETTAIDTDAEYAADDLVEEPWGNELAGCCCEPAPDPYVQVWETSPAPIIWDAPAVLDTPVVVPAAQPVVAPLTSPDTPAAIVAEQPVATVAAVELPLPVETSPGFGPTVMSMGTAYAAEPTAFATTMPLGTAYAAEPTAFATTMPMGTAYASEPGAFATVMPTAPAFDSAPGPLATTFTVSTTPSPLAGLYVKAVNNGDLLQQVQLLGLMGHDNRMSWLPTPSIF